MTHEQLEVYASAIVTGIQIMDTDEEKEEEAKRFLVKALAERDAEIVEMINKMHRLACIPGYNSQQDLGTHAELLSTVSTKIKELP